MRVFCSAGDQYSVIYMKACAPKGSNIAASSLLSRSLIIRSEMSLMTNSTIQNKYAANVLLVKVVSEKTILPSNSKLGTTNIRKGMRKFWGRKGPIKGVPAPYNVPKKYPTN